MATRDKTGRFVKGQTGNPKGRGRGTGNSIGVRLRREIEPDAPDLIRKLVKDALAGDTETARWLLDKVMPRLRPEPAPAAISLEGSAQEVADRLKSAVSEGEISAETAAELLSLVRQSQIGNEALNMPTDAELDALYASAIAKSQADKARVRSEIEAGLRGGPTH